MSVPDPRLPILDRLITLEEDRRFGDLVERIAACRNQRIFFCNVHMLMLSRDDVELAVAMAQADWVFADGAPVAWLQRRLLRRNAQIINGYEVMLAACRRAALTGEKVGLLGSTPDVLERLARSLQDRFPGLNIPYRFAPPFAQDHLVLSEEQSGDLRAAELDWLFVGLGCPKQEKWVDRYGPGLGCHVLAVGAAFDWLSGNVRKPPDWMERAGLAWFFRLMQNPRRMWYRYLIYNSKFVSSAAGVLLRKRFGARSRGRAGR